MENNQRPEKPKQEKPLQQVLIGVLTPAISIAVIMLLGNIIPEAAAILVDFAIIIVGVFLGIKLIRKNYKIAGIIILSLYAPILFLSMAAGACMLILKGGGF